MTKAVTLTVVVAVQPGTAGPPVYCFHPLGGSAAVYGDLATHLGRDRIVYGVQAVGLLPGQEADRTVARMARRYATAIAEQPPAEAPLFLGYSMGGVLALETARLLPVHVPQPRIVAIDCDPTYAVGADGGPWKILVHQVLNLDLELDELAGLSTVEALIRIRAAGAAQRRLPARFGLDRLERMLMVCRVNEQAAAAHVPAYYSGTVHAFRSTAGSTDSGVARGPDSWTLFCDEVVVHPVPADHHTIMSPSGYPIVAERLRHLVAGTASARQEQP
jgi:thioesterase domain-containing protein